MADRNAQTGNLISWLYAGLMLTFDASSVNESNCKVLLSGGIECIVPAPGFGTKVRGSHTMKMVRCTLIFLAFSLGMLIAQNGVQRTIVQRGDISVPGREAVALRIEIAPGGSTGRHTHSGDETDYVLEGQLEVTIDGHEPKIVKAGEAIVIPAGAVHNAQNKGSEPLKAVGVYIVEKGKPMTTPAS